MIFQVLPLSTNFTLIAVLVGALRLELRTPLVGGRNDIDLLGRLAIGTLLDRVTISGAGGRNSLYDCPAAVIFNNIGVAVERLFAVQTGMGVLLVIELYPHVGIRSMTTTAGVLSLPLLAVFAVINVLLGSANRAVCFGLFLVQHKVVCTLLRLYRNDLRLHDIAAGTFPVLVAAFFYRLAKLHMGFLSTAIVTALHSTNKPVCIAHIVRLSRSVRQRCLVFTRVLHATNAGTGGIGVRSKVFLLRLSTTVAEKAMTLVVLLIFVRIQMIQSWHLVFRTTNFCRAENAPNLRISFCSTGRRNDFGLEVAVVIAYMTVPYSVAFIGFNHCIIKDYFSTITGPFLGRDTSSSCPAPIMEGFIEILIALCANSGMMPVVEIYIG